MTDAPPRPDAATLAAFAATVLFLGSNFVAVRFSNRELEPLWGAGLRFTVAAALLAAWVALRRIPWPQGRAQAGAALFGLLAFAANFGLLYWGLQWVPAGLASVVFATIPLITFLATVALRLEAFRWQGLAGAVVVVAGVAILSWDAVRSDVPLRPLLAVCAASLCAALSGIVVKRVPRSHPLAFNAVAMAVGAVALLAGSMLLDEPVALPREDATWAAVAWLVASSVVAFSLMVWVLSRWTASANAYGAVLAPLVTVPLAAVLADEAVGSRFLAAAAVVLVGVYLGALGPGIQPRRAVTKSA